MKTIDILTLLATPNIGKASVQKILDFKGTPGSFNTASEIQQLIADVAINNKRIKVPSIEDITKGQSEAITVLERSEKAGVAILPFFDPRFPENLKNIPDAPLIIHAKGNLEILSYPKNVAIIGTREPSDTGKKFGLRISEVFTEQGFIITSGLALGCDTVGHQGCLNKKGKTIAVLAHGLDSVYPKENKDLAEQIIANGGCLISEYSIGSKYNRNYFVERDRLQSGIARAIIVIETAIKGGTMHTVSFAQKQKKPIATLVGHPDFRINHPKTEGNKYILDKCSGHPLSNSEDVCKFINYLGFEFIPTATSPTKNSVSKELNSSNTPITSALISEILNSEIFQRELDAVIRHKVEKAMQEILQEKISSLNFKHENDYSSFLERVKADLSKTINSYISTGKLF